MNSGAAERVSSSCSTSGTRRVNLVTNLVISDEWGKNREVFNTYNALTSVEILIEQWNWLSVEKTAINVMVTRVSSVWMCISCTIFLRDAESHKTGNNLNVVASEKIKQFKHDTLYQLMLAVPKMWPGVWIETGVKIDIGKKVTEIFA